MINLEIHYPADQACETDAVDKALNYKTITKEVISLVEEGHFLRKLVAEILASIKAFTMPKYASINLMRCALLIQYH